MRTTSLFFSLFVLMTGCDGGPKARTEIETPDAASQTEDAAGSVRDAATPKPDQGEEPVVHPDAATSDAMPDSGIETDAAIRDTLPSETPDAAAEKDAAVADAMPEPTDAAVQIGDAESHDAAIPDAMPPPFDASVDAAPIAADAGPISFHVIVCTYAEDAVCELCEQIELPERQVCVIVQGPQDQTIETWLDQDYDGFPEEDPVEGRDSDFEPDTCPTGWNREQHADTDEDGVLNGCDNCVTIANPLQENTNQDWAGDACEHLGIDDDGDCYCEGLPREGGPPGCIRGASPCEEFLGVGDCDDSDANVSSGDENGCTVDARDSDHDWVLNFEDNCVAVPNPDQTDADHDGNGQACEASSTFTWTRGDTELPIETQMVSLSATCIFDLDGGWSFAFRVDSPDYGREVETIELIIPYGDHGSVSFCFVTLLQNEVEGPTGLPPGQGAYTFEGQAYEAIVNNADVRFDASWLVDLTEERRYSPD